MAWDSWTLVWAALFMAGVVKGATGIGYATCALPALATVIGLKAAMAVVLIPTFATNLSLAVSSRGNKPLLWRFSPLYVAMIPGVAAGVYLLPLIEQHIATNLLGLLLIGYALLSLTKPNWKLSPTHERTLKVPVGFINGLLTGITGSQVLPLVPYMLSAKLDACESIQAINLGVLLLTTLLGVGLIATSATDFALVQDSLMGAFPAMGGVYAGTMVRARLPQTQVRTLVFVTVGLIGCKMISN